MDKSDKTGTPETIKPVFPIPHFVCTGGCKLYSETRIYCPSTGCLRARNLLTQCECTDGKHGELLNRGDAFLNKKT